MDEAKLYTHISACCGEPIFMDKDKVYKYERGGALKHGYRFRCSKCRRVCFVKESLWGVDRYTRLLVNQYEKLIDSDKEPA